MKIVVIQTDSDKPWSFTGWKLNYIQLTATTWGYQFVDPAGTVHKETAGLHNGFHLQYNVRSFAHLLESALNSSNADNAMVKYRLKNVEPESVSL